MSPKVPHDDWFGYAKAIVASRAGVAIGLLWTIVSGWEQFNQLVIRDFLSPNNWQKWEPFTHVSVSIEWWLIGILGLLLPMCIHKGYRLYQEARIAEQQVRDDFDFYRRGRLKVTWDPTKHPGLWWDVSQPTPALYYRIEIKNVSGSTVDDVTVELSEQDPLTLPGVPCPLRLMNNIMGVHETIHKTSLNPGDKCYIDFIVQSESMNKDQMWILHTVQPLPVEVDRHPYRFVVRISARNLPDLMRTYQLTLGRLTDVPAGVRDAGYFYTMTEL